MGAIVCIFVSFNVFVSTKLCLRSTPVITFYQTGLIKKETFIDILKDMCV